MGHHKRHHVLHRQFCSSHRQQPRLLPFRPKALRRTLASNAHHPNRLRLYLDHRNLRFLILQRHLRKTHLEPPRPPRLLPQRRRRSDSSRRLHHRRLFHPRSTRNKHRSKQYISWHRHDRPRTKIPNNKKRRVYLRSHRSTNLPVESIKGREPVHNLPLSILRLPLINCRGHCLRLLFCQEGIYSSSGPLLGTQKWPILLQLRYTLACLCRIHRWHLDQYHRFPRCVWLESSENGGKCLQLQFLRGLHYFSSGILDFMQTIPNSSLLG